MPILVLLIVVVILLFRGASESISLRNRANAYAAAREARGGNLPTDREKEEGFLHELEENYQYGDKSMFPPEKLDFFAHSPGSWPIWAYSEAEERMIALGYAPIYPLYPYDRAVYTDHYFYRASRVAEEEKEYYRQKAMREKYQNSAQ